MDWLRLRPPKAAGLEPRDVEQLGKYARHDFYGRIRSVMFAIPAIACGAGWYARAPTEHPTGYYTLCGALTIIAGVRWLLASGERAARPEPPQLLICNALGVVSTFAMALGLVLLVLADGIWFGTLVAVLAVMCFATVVASFNALHRTQARALIIATALPSLLLLLEPQHRFISLAAGVGLYCVVLLTIAQRFGAWQWDARVKSLLLKSTARRQTKLSRLVGRAEVATGILHDVGNVLNSVKSSMQTASRRIERMPTTDLRGVAALLSEHDGELPEFFAHDERAAAVPAFIVELAERSALLREEAAQELERAKRYLDHVEVIVQRQQEHARPTSETEIIELDDLVGESIDFVADTSSIERTSLTMEPSPRLVVCADRHRVLQILINLLKNAVEATEGVPEPRIAVRMHRVDERQVAVVVVDNGHGLAEADRNRMFARGFTTKAHGHGFGLHSSRLLARALGGDLTFTSDGPGKGAQFTLLLRSTAHATAA